MGMAGIILLVLVTVLFLRLLYWSIWGVSHYGYYDDLGDWIFYDYYPGFWGGFTFGMIVGSDAGIGYDGYWNGGDGIVSDQNYDQNYSQSDTGTDYSGGGYGGGDYSGGGDSGGGGSSC